MRLFLCLSLFRQGRYCQKNVAKVGVWEKNIVWGLPYGGVSLDGGFKPSAYYDSNRSSETFQQILFHHFNRNLNRRCLTYFFFITFLNKWIISNILQELELYHLDYVLMIHLKHWRSRSKFLRLPLELFPERLNT